MPAHHPNILLVHCHDLGQYLHCYGVETVQTPHLDAFAGRGVQFTRSYCASPGCSPSRAALFTGRYPHSNGVMGLVHADFAWDLHPQERHLAQILAKNGLRTAAIGVVHETGSPPERCGYQQYLPGGSAQATADAAIALLQRFKQDQSQPFFLSVGFHEPHRVPVAQDGDHGFAAPPLQADETLGVQVPGYLRDTPGTRAELAELQGAIHTVDGQFGRLSAALEGLDLAQDTLLIFTTDHGVAMPRAKCSLYEPGIRVAFILRLPTRPGWHGGLRQPAMISNVDVLPTLLELLGIPVPTEVQGRSFAALLDGREFTPRGEIFAEMTYHDYYDPRRSMRDERYKLIANFSSAPAFMDPSQSWRPRSDTRTPPNHALAYHNLVELYDLQEDPWEQVDLSGSPAHQEIKRSLSARLHDWMQSTADPLLEGAVLSPHHSRTAAYLKNAHKP